MKLTTRLFLLPATCLAVCIAGSSVRAEGVFFAEPEGGWLYSYDGTGTAFGSGPGTADSLDGSWFRGVSSDSWDGSGLGGTFDPVTNNPGGVESLTEGEVSYLRIQDPGDPRHQAVALGYAVPDRCNRKIYFARPLNLTGDALDTGLTLAFRIRIATTGVLDPQFPSTNGAGENNTVAGGAAWIPNGSLNADGGKGFLTLHGATSGTVAFSPATPVDQYNQVGTLFGTNALSMNNLNGTTRSPDVDPWSLEGGTTNMLPLMDWSQWHEFWITIQSDTSGGGTHHIEIFVDGAFEPVRFELTAGTGDEGGPSETLNYIGMGFGNSAQMGAVDLDYLAFREGVIQPAPEPGTVALLAGGTLLLTRRRPGGG